MTALNKYFLTLAAIFLFCLPATGQENGSSADAALRKAAVFHNNYEFEKAAEYYRKALELTTDSLQRPSIADRLLQCANGKSLLEYIVRPTLVTTGTFRTDDFYLYLGDLEDRSWIPVPNPFIKTSDK